MKQVATLQAEAYYLLSAGFLLGFSTDFMVSYPRR
jgi:hypothetical protein